MNAIATSLSGPFPDTVKAGLQSLGSAIQSNDLKDAILLVPHLGSFDTTVTAEVFGKEIAKELQKNRKVQITDGVTLHLHSPKTISPGLRADSLIAVYVALDNVTSVIGSLTPLHTVVFVPWMDDERDGFVSFYNADIVNVPDPREVNPDQ